MSRDTDPTGARRKTVKVYREIETALEAMAAERGTTQSELLREAALKLRKQEAQRQQRFG